MRSNADGSSDTSGGGAAGKSANATVSIASGTTGSIAAAVAAVPGAPRATPVWGAAGSEVLGAITTINSLVITANATGTQTAASPAQRQFHQRAGVRRARTSGFQVGLERRCESFDRHRRHRLDADRRRRRRRRRVDAALKNRWDNYRLSPDTMWVSSQVADNLSAEIFAGGSTRHSASCSTPIRARSAAA